MIKGNHMSKKMYGKDIIITYFYISIYFGKQLNRYHYHIYDSHNKLVNMPLEFESWQKRELDEGVRNLAKFYNVSYRA